MISRRMTKLKIVLRQNIYAFLIVTLWFGLNFTYFFFLYQDAQEALKVVFFFKDGPGEYAFFYSKFTEFIIFGLVFSLITVELFRKYNPVVTSRELSKKLEDHVVIIGYSNIARRIHNYFEKEGIPHVIIDKDLDLIEDLVSEEEPVINDDVLSKQTLVDAGVEKAKAVFILINNIEVQMFVNYEVRQLNKNVKIISRIFQDDIGDLISKTYNVQIISTSKYAADVIMKRIREYDHKRIILLGINHISSRLINDFNKERIDYIIIEEDEEKLEDLMIEINDPHLIIGDPKELSTLRKAKIQEVDCVINLNKDVTNTVLVTRQIRELNKECKVLNRIFLDSVAEMLEKPPFNSEIISSSKETIRSMIEEGFFNI